MPRATADGSHLVMGGPNHSLRILDAADGTLLEELAGGRPDNAVYFAFSPDGRRIVSQGHLGHHLVRDWAQRTIAASLPDAKSTDAGLDAAAFTANSDMVVVARAPDTIDFREIHAPPAQMTLAGHERVVKCVAFSPDGQTVASVSRDGTLRLWSTETGQELQTLAAHPSAFDLAYSPDGAYIATGGSDGAKLWSRVRAIGRDAAALDGSARVDVSCNVSPGDSHSSESWTC